MIKYEIKKAVSKKTNKEVYFLNTFVVYPSGKRFKICSCFIDKHIYDMLNAEAK